jgi:hypothetical protein
MERHRSSALKLALLLVLMLPLQGFAAAFSCEPLDSAAAAAAPTADHHCPHGSSAVQHHACGTCCSAAMVVTPLQWVPPRSISPRVRVPLLFSPPNIVLDRLDRPPRPAA